MIGVAVWFITHGGAATVGAALDGAIFGFYVTAVWSFVIRTEQSGVYRQSFIDPDAADAIIVAIHHDDADVIEQAQAASGD